MKKLLASLCILLPSLALADTSATFYERAQQATFKVRPYCIMSCGGGTGFMIELPRGTFIVTNRHVCEAGNTDATKFFVQQGETWWTATLVAKSNVNDLCLIKPPKAMVDSVVAFRLSRTDVDKGDVVLSYGFPGLGSFKACVGQYVQSEKVSGGFLNFFTNQHLLMIGVVTFKVIGGQSGSPVLNETGEVVGVVFASVVADKTGNIVPLAQLNKFVETLE